MVKNKIVEDNVINSSETLINVSEEKSLDSLKNIKLSEEELEVIADKVAKKLQRNERRFEPKSEVLEEYFNYLEPKQIFIKQEEFSKGVRIAGLLIFSLCVWYWVYFFFFVQNYEALTYTTYITLILISFVCINKFESPMLNSLVGIMGYGFLVISLLLLPVSLDRDIYKFFGFFVLHIAIAIFQFYLIIHPKIAMSKKYLIFSFLFYLLFLSSYDQFFRLNIMTEQSENFTDLYTQVHFFYSLGIAGILIYLYKKRYGILLP